MLYETCKIQGAILITPKIWGDSRGYFFESYRADEFEQNIGKIVFVQENQSLSTKNVVRGLHFQRGTAAQAKLLRIVEGTVRDVFVDLRLNSPTFGQWDSVTLNNTSNIELFLPRGLAHGFAVLSDYAVLQYRCDNYYSPKDEDGLAWDDPTLAIDWGVNRDVAILSEKDKHRPLLADAYKF